MNFENIHINDIPSVDIAMWIAKIDRTKLALTEQMFVTGEDGQCALALADPNPELIEHWSDATNRNEAYEAVVLYELVAGLSLGGLKRVLRVAEVEPIDPIVFPEGPLTYQEQHFRARKLSDQALLTGLGRLGMIRAGEDQICAVPDGVLAAFMYKRASIRQMSDRQLYERAEEIDRLTRHITETTEPRTMQLLFSNKTTSEMTVYRGMIYQRSAMNSGSDDPSSSVYNEWWTELGTDFRRIEQALVITA